MGLEAIERLRFLVSLPLAGTGRGKEARKRNLSIASNPVSVHKRYDAKCPSTQRQSYHPIKTLVFRLRRFRGRQLHRGVPQQDRRHERHQVQLLRRDGHAQPAAVFDRYVVCVVRFSIRFRILIFYKISHI